jgi:hypothetical protein
MSLMSQYLSSFHLRKSRLNGVFDSEKYALYYYYYYYYVFVVVGGVGGDGVGVGVGGGGVCKYYAYQERC